MSEAPAFDRGANVLGALALALSDRMAAAVAEAAGGPGRPGSETAGAALSALHHFLDAPSVDRLRQVLGLTSSGTVRLVDRLVDLGYVRRARGDDGRTTVVSLTPSGRRAAARVAKARAAVLTDALAALDPGERAALDPLLGRLAAALIRGPGATRWMCRLCQTGLCGVPTRECPVTRAAFERHAARTS